MEGWFHSSHCSTMMRMATWSAQGLLLWKMPAGLGAFCVSKRIPSCSSGSLESTASFFVSKESVPVGLGA